MTVGKQQNQSFASNLKLFKTQQMKKTVITYGLISGIIASIWMLGTVAIGMENMDNDWGMILGFTTMIIAFAFIFVAVRKYRENYGHGAITFGQALKIGLLIALIGSTMYVVSWLIDYYLFVPDFMDTFTAHTMEKLKASGASQAEITATAAQMANYKEMYKNPLFVTLFTYMEILPVGILFSLLAAFTMKKKPQEPLTHKP
jgi:drug/metabolite transporter (DMT)-like permease